MMKLPKHLCCSIDHNPHKATRDTVQYYIVQYYIDQLDHLRKIITAEDMKICIERDELWCFQWYPPTPISFEVVLSYSLERCLELANEFE